MKNSILPLWLSIIIVTNSLAQSISESDRSKVLSHLQESKNKLLNTIGNLSEEQLYYKPSASKWSIAECLEHLALSEKSLSAAIQMTHNEESGRVDQTDIALSDEALIELITDRTNKVKTRAEFEPTESFGSFQSTLAAFREVRESNIHFVENTSSNLRSQYFDFPFGKVDAVQVLLFISAHTQRHVQQMKELISLQSFPG
ncbi:MAG: DinB family protein [Bacteroidota bacterium]